MSSPKVSVVMSVYNGEHYLRESVDSILNQAFTDFEFIIIDDGSSDSTWQILAEAADQDQRVRLFKNEENVGLTKSLNKGLRLAQGEYIARQDADDMSLPDRLMLQTRFLDKYLEVGALGTAVEAIDDQGRSLGRREVITEHENLQAYLLVNNCFCHTSLMVRRSLVQDLGGYNEKLRYAQDYDLWLRLGRLARLGNLPDTLVLMRYSANSLTRTHRQEQLLYSLEISLKVVRESLEGQPLDKRAYQRFWWSYLRLLDKEAYQRFWWSYHGQCAQLRREDIQYLWPFWKLLAAHPGGPQVWGPRLHRLAYDLLRRRQIIQGLQLLWLVAHQLKMPIEWGPVIKDFIRPFVVALGYEVRRA